MFKGNPFGNTKSIVHWYNKSETRKDWFFIDPLKIQYTTDMEKALHGAHGIGYETYRRSCGKRIEVEMKRERDYAASQLTAMHINGNHPIGK